MASAVPKMLTINVYPYENCTKKCKNREHGDRNNSVKESISNEKGELYAVGLGLGDGGRLGTVNESTLVLPKRIHLTNQYKNECVVGISALRNHWIILTIENRVRSTIRLRIINFNLMDFQSFHRFSHAVGIPMAKSINQTTARNRWSSVEFKSSKKRFKSAVCHYLKTETDSLF